MSKLFEPTVLAECRDLVRTMVHKRGLDDAALSILARSLTPEEAIGAPGRRDFPIIEGKERIIEAVLLGARGQAFTDAPAEFVGPMGDVLSLPLTSNRNRALLVATINATVRHLRLLERTTHCRDDAPEKCGLEIATHLREAGSRSLGLVGLNPAIAEALVRAFGREAVRITDLNPKNIGATRFGVEVWDGRSRWEELIKRSETVLVTGTTLVNGTFDQLFRSSTTAGRNFVVYGVTAAGVCHLKSLPHLCPFAQE